MSMQQLERNDVQQLVLTNADALSACHKEKYLVKSNSLLFVKKKKIFKDILMHDLCFLITFDTKSTVARKKKLMLRKQVAYFHK